MLGWSQLQDIAVSSQIWELDVKQHPKMESQAKCVFVRVIFAMGWKECYLSLALVSSLHWLQNMHFRFLGTWTFMFSCPFIFEINASFLLFVPWIHASHNFDLKYTNFALPNTQNNFYILLHGNNPQPIVLWNRD